MSTIGHDVIRLLFAPSFRQPAVVIRVDGDRAQVTEIPQGDSFPDGPARALPRQLLTVDQVRRLRALVQSVSALPIITHDRGYDGADFVLETVVDGRSHTVIRWGLTRETEPEFVALTRAMIDLIPADTGVQVPLSY